MLDPANDRQVGAIELPGRKAAMDRRQSERA